MTSYGKNIHTTKMVCTDMHSTGKIFWQDFEPPLASAGVSNLAAVLAASEPDGDANDLPINDLGGLKMTGDINLNNNDISNGTSIASNRVIADEMLFSVQAGTTLSGSSLANNPTVVSNMDLRSATNIFPTSIDDDTVEDVLIRGSDANGQNLSNVNSFSATTVNVLSGGSLLAAGASSIQLGETQMFGNVNMQDATPTKHSILNANAISTESLSATGTTGFAGQIGATRQITAPIIQISAPYTGQPVNSGIEFNSAITETTEIRGVSVANRTKLLNCDLSSTTNLQAAPTTERYEWMSVWSDATTNFPPPDGWKPYTAPQIPPIKLVYFDFWSNRDSTDFWRFFAPMSDSDRQIDPDDKMGLHEGEYIHGADNAAVWPYAFYGLSASTNISSHASQIVEFTFTSAQYGYGRIYAALAIQYSPFTAAPEVLNNTFRLMMEHEGTALATNPRISGPTTMKWYVPNVFPTDGTQVRIYPVIRTDDAVTTEGRLVIRIGNGQPLYGQNPGDPQDFTPADTNAQQSQLILRGYPLSAEFLYFPNPPGQISSGA